MASDFENQNLKKEISELKKSNMSLSNISINSKKSLKTAATMTDQHGLPMITIPINEKKKEVKFNLGDESNRISTKDSLRQKLSKIRLEIVGVVKQVHDQKKAEDATPSIQKEEPQRMNVKHLQNVSSYA